ncbi:hypothetical protein JH06_2840 [Blastocystis sp. subtype 4]|uniref:hypothetical protein n=1 Tax=Blastocystis sp. subtype 4 TaxID=944170 RepID=UPI000711BF1F|nr:hypothetical protein JH06_2840 [Blastocystis sp. subtype 4]KNB43425.1 hypothetical protein JH06_2840 [Blastocystis sp. subtype 4]|eukprot:XP_014526868.1 hypothetical protein JH06_2840 [Blastocystis sp. subtype 4]
MLGSIWWHSVTTQLLLARTPQGARLLSVKKSPFLECCTIPFTIIYSGFSTDSQCIVCYKQKIRRDKNKTWEPLRYPSKDA